MKLTPEFEATLRARISPNYVDMPNTYSAELAALFGEIDMLRDALDKKNKLLDRSIACYHTLADEIKSKKS